MNLFQERTSERIQTSNGPDNSMRSEEIKAMIQKKFERTEGGFQEDLGEAFLVIAGEGKEGLEYFADTFRELTKAFETKKGADFLEELPKYTRTHVLKQLDRIQYFFILLADLEKLPEFTDYWRIHWHGSMSDEEMEEIAAKYP